MRSPAASVASKTTKVDVACTGQNAAPWPRWLVFHHVDRWRMGRESGVPFV